MGLESDKNMDEHLALAGAPVARRLLLFSMNTAKPDGQTDPISPADEAHSCAGRVTRRQFGTQLTRAGIAALLTTVSGMLTGCFRRKYPEKVIAQAGEIPIGGFKIFQYPDLDKPCLLIRLNDDNYVAYSRLCTHVQCPVSYDPEGHEIVCPCHGGVFSVADGSVLQGPPKDPLPRIVLARRGEEIVATGLIKS